MPSLSDLETNIVIQPDLLGSELVSLRKLHITGICQEEDAAFVEMLSTLQHLRDLKMLFTAGLTEDLAAFAPLAR